MAPTPGPILEPPLSPVITESLECGYPMSPRNNSLTSTNTKGLLNMPGQNNCFLNSAVQVLWHLDIFRRSFRELTGHACMAESCTFCALKELFTQFQYSQESALPPDVLRHALAKTFCDQRRFQLGFMDDAAECFENILLRIHVHIANAEHEDMCGDPKCIPHQKFAMTLVEQPICHNCGATSEPLPFTQMVHYVTTSALCAQAIELSQHGYSMQNNFGTLLQIADNVGEVRKCSSGCGSKFQIKKTLMNRPEIVSIGLVWDSECPSLQHITDVFHSIGMCLRLKDMFHYVYDYEWADTSYHQLVGVVTYYGKHYSTFFFHTKLRVWIYFDDAVVREIGPSWEMVVEKCQKGRFQPLLLLFANPNGTSISNSSTCFGGAVNQLNEKQDVIKRYLMLQSKSPSEMIQHISHKNMERQNSSPLYYPRCDSTIYTQQSTIPDMSKNQITSNIKPYRQNTNAPVYSNVNSLGILVPPMKYNHTNSHQQLPTHNLLPNHSYANNTTVTNGAVISNTYDHCQQQAKNLPPLKPAKSCTRASPLTYCGNMQQYRTKDMVNSTKDSDSAFTEDDPENNDTYISRKTVENVLNLQKLQRHMSLGYSHASVGNRNSSSSLESFDNMNCAATKLNPLQGHRNLDQKITLLQRRDSRDSGNWSSDRNSSSSTTSNENPYLNFVTSKRLLLGNNSYQQVVVPKLPDYSNHNGSDHGYDSYSVSSSDSYPSINNSPIKIEPRLTQIPEDWNAQDIDLDQKLKIVTEEVIDCDKLCAEADLLLAKSNEKEKEGDLVMAALLCDAAAARARQAMDAPYNNSKSLVSAKMKHSTCVLRSSCLYRRLKDNEADERRKQKGHHSRQSSRDSSHSRHSRQGSKDNTHQKSSPKESQLGDDLENNKNIEIYGTLPKKNSKKKSSSPNTTKAKDDQVYKDFLDKQRKNTNYSPTNDQLHKSSKIENAKIKSSVTGDKSSKKASPDTTTVKLSLHKRGDIGGHSAKEVLSDGQNTHKKSNKQAIEQSYFVLFPSHDSDCTNEVDKSERDLVSPTNSADKKQHRIKRKLGGFMKRKNRSLPDLRADEELSDDYECSVDDTSIPLPSTLTLPNGKLKKLEYQSSDANVSNISRGFHQPHHAFVKKDLTQRPLLMKVNPPNVQTSALTSPTLKQTHTMSSLQKKLPDSKTKKELNLSSEKPSKIPFITSLLRSEGIHPSSLQTLKKVDGKPPISPPRVSSIPVLTTLAEKSPEIGKSQNGTQLSPHTTSDELPAASNSFLAEIQAKRNQIISRENSPDKKETKKEVRTSKLLQPTAHKTIPSHLPKLTTNNDSTNSNSWLKELQTKQMQRQSKLKESIHTDEKRIQDHGATKSNPEKQVMKTNSNLQSLDGNQITKEKTTVLGYRPLANTSSSSDNKSHKAADKKPNSVKDLASKFEKILIPTAESSTSNVESSDGSLHEPPQIIPQQNVQTNMKENPMKQENPEPTLVHMLPCTSAKQACDTAKEVSQYGCSRNAIKLPNSLQNDHNQIADVTTKLQRPQQPPDYETAMQRLEFIRTNRTENSPMSVVEKERSLPLVTKESSQSSAIPSPKKKGSKKTVTFSDKVVLVACAEFDESGFFSNPLLGRVYQKHIESGGKEVPEFNNLASYRTEQAISDAQNLQVDCNSQYENNELSQCNLCHNNYVVPPTVYCADCAFYMSRYQPSNM